MPKKPRVLFVCKANRGRSPTAELLLKNITKGRVKVSSAGLKVKERSLGSFTKQVLKENGISTRGFRAKPLTKNLAKKYDLIIVFTKWQKRAVERDFGGGGKTHVITSYVGESGQVSDYWHVGLAGHRKRARMIKRLVAKLSRKL